MAIEMPMAMVMGCHSPCELWELDAIHHANGNGNHPLWELHANANAYDAGNANDNANADAHSNGNAHGNATSTANGHFFLTCGNAMWDLDASHHNAIFPVTCGSLMLMLIAMVVLMAMLMVLLMVIHP